MVSCCASDHRVQGSVDRGQGQRLSHTLSVPHRLATPCFGAAATG
jgi:hypothetical protein